MMPEFARVLVPLSLLLGTSAASAQQRCVSSHYRLPPSIAEDLRPYLLCALIHEHGDTGAVVNGTHVLMHGPGFDACGDVRTRAFNAAYLHLTSIIQDPRARQDFLYAEFEKADAFLLDATNRDDLSIGEEPTAPPCSAGAENGTSK
jgi:hypothetical protein